MVLEVKQSYSTYTEDAKVCSWNLNPFLKSMLHFTVYPFILNALCWCFCKSLKNPPFKYSKSQLLCLLEPYVQVTACWPVLMLLVSICLSSVKIYLISLLNCTYAPICSLHGASPWIICCYDTCTQNTGIHTPLHSFLKRKLWEKSEKKRLR